LTIKESPVQPYLVLKALHILLIVTWLGMDIGLFTSSFFVRNTNLSAETRLQMGRLGSILDMGPRNSGILMIAFGLLLTYYGGWGFQGVPAVLIWLTVLTLGVWIGAIWQWFFTVRDLAAGRIVGRRVFFVRTFRNIDIYLRLAIGLTFIAFGVLGAFQLGPILFGWLDLKLTLFGLILLVGIAIRLMSDDFPIVLGEIARLGSTQEREERLSRALNRVYPLVLGIYSLIVAITIIAVTKPL
jgi:hypothetical protein